MLKNKIACALTLYHPMPEDLNNVILYAQCFDLVLAYDNSEKTGNYECFLPYASIQVLSNGQNDGLAVSCHACAMEAKRQGYDYIMYFDQDSRMETSQIQKLDDAICDLGKDIALYCPQIVYHGEPKKSSESYTEIKRCITSGSILNLKYYGDVLQFDERYFIDRVDIDLCRQATDAGSKIVQVNECLLYQTLGNNRKVWGKERTTHKAYRHYYMARNRLYYNDKYHVSKVVTALQVLRHQMKILFVEEDKIQKLSMVFLGMKDYRKGKMGKKE